MKYKRTKSGLVIPEEKTKKEKWRENFITRYKLEHKYCPKCYSSSHETTLMGCIQPNPFEYRDNNHSYCMDCDWKGRVHSRVPYNTYQGELEYTNKKYHQKHRFCPECGSEEVGRTCVGSLYNSNSNPDTNKATCDCGWSGIVHDLAKYGWFDVYKEPLLDDLKLIGRAKANSFEEACYKVIKEYGRLYEYDYDNLEVDGRKLFRSKEEYDKYVENRGY